MIPMSPAPLSPAEWAINLVRRASQRVEAAEFELVDAQIELAAAQANLDIVAPR
jgi:hypothetical protein